MNKAATQVKLSEEKLDQDSLAVAQPQDQVVQVVQDKKSSWTILKESSIETAPKFLAGLILIGLSYLGTKSILEGGTSVADPIVPPMES